MGKSDSSSSSSEPADKKKKGVSAAAKPKAASGPRFNAFASSSEDEAPAKDKAGGFSKAGISTASAADSFCKKQWELMEALKVDYKKQTDKKTRKEEKEREKDIKRIAKKEKKRAKRKAEEDEAAAELAAAEKAITMKQNAEAAQEAFKETQRREGAAKLKGPFIPEVNDK